MIYRLTESCLMPRGIALEIHSCRRAQITDIAILSTRVAQLRLFGLSTSGFWAGTLGVEVQES